MPAPHGKYHADLKDALKGWLSQYAATAWPKQENENALKTFEAEIGYEITSTAPDTPEDWSSVHIPYSEIQRGLMGIMVPYFKHKEIHEGWFRATWTNIFYFDDRVEVNESIINGEVYLCEDFCVLNGWLDIGDETYPPMPAPANITEVTETLHFGGVDGDGGGVPGSNDDVRQEIWEDTEVLRTTSMDVDKEQEDEDSMGEEDWAGAKARKKFAGTSRVVDAKDEAERKRREEVWRGMEDERRRNVESAFLAEKRREEEERKREQRRELFGRLMMEMEEKHKEIRRMDELTAMLQRANLTTRPSDEEKTPRA
ncbi:hypothetical protein HDU67_005067, partial [Dinochytrium kinnereticum]